MIKIILTRLRTGFKAALTVFFTEPAFFGVLTKFAICSLCQSTNSFIASLRAFEPSSCPGGIRLCNSREYSSAKKVFHSASVSIVVISKKCKTK